MDLFKDRKKLYGLIIILCVYFIRQFLFYNKGINLSEEGFRLYVYWNIKEGAVLYKDIYYYSGLISPYFYGMIFKIFGAELLYVRIAAVLLGGVCIAGLYLIALEIMPVIWAAFSSFFTFHLFYMSFYEYGYLLSIPCNYFAIFFLYKSVKNDFNKKYLIISSLFGALSCLHNMYQEGAATNIAIFITLIFSFFILKNNKINYKLIIYYVVGVVSFFVLAYIPLFIVVPFEKLMNGLFSFLRGRYPNPVSGFFIPNIFEIIRFIPENLSLENLYFFAKKTYYHLLYILPYFVFIFGLIFSIKIRKTDKYKSILIFLLSLFSLLSAVRIILWYRTGSSDVFNIAPALFLTIYFTYRLLMFLREKFQMLTYRIVFMFFTLFAICGYLISIVPNLNPELNELRLNTNGLKGITVQEEYNPLISDASDFLKKLLPPDEKYCSIDHCNYIGFLSKRKRVFNDDLYIFHPFRQYGLNYVIPSEGYFNENKRKIFNVLEREKPKVIITQTDNKQRIKESFPDLDNYIDSNYNYVKSFGLYNPGKYRQKYYEYWIMQLNFYLRKDLEIK